MRLRDYTQIGLATIVAALLLKLFVLDAVIVSSPSMERTLLVGDLVLVNKLIDTRTHGDGQISGAGFSMPHLPFLGQLGRGDVVVFRYPGDRDESEPQKPVEFVKRCVGLPGDTVEIRDGRLFVNDIAASWWAGASASGPHYPRGFVDNRLFPRDGKQNLDHYGPIIVPKAGDVIRLHDRVLPLYEKLIRSEGHEVSMRNGDLLIDGKPASRYTVGRNYLFVLGDNNYESSDSRFWGFLPEEHIIGKAAVIYWSKRPVRDDGTGGLEQFMASIRWDRIGAFVQ